MKQTKKQQEIRLYFPFLSVIASLMVFFVIYEMSEKIKLQSQFNSYKNHSIDYEEGWKLVPQEECWNESKCENYISDEASIVGARCSNGWTCSGINCFESIKFNTAKVVVCNVTLVISYTTRKCYNQTICKPSDKLWEEECLEYNYEKDSFCVIAKRVCDDTDDCKDLNRYCREDCIKKRITFEVER